MYRLSRLITLAALAAILLAWSLLVPGASEAAPRPVTGKGKSGAGVEDPVALRLARAIDALDWKPSRVDPITTFERVTSNGRVVTYHYRISRREAPDEDLRQLILEHGVTKACQNPTMLQAMKDWHVTYRYSYIMPDSTKPLVVDATYGQCTALGLGG